MPGERHDGAGGALLQVVRSTKPASRWWDLMLPNWMRKRYRHVDLDHRKLFLALERVADQPDRRRPQADEQRAAFGVAALVLVDGLGSDP
jgi:hypothetical protein